MYHTAPAATDRRVIRRSLSADEFARLLTAAAAGKPVEAIPGPERALLYLIACWTGLRRGELASLTRRSFEFSPGGPVVSVQAAHSKRRRMDSIPLHPVVADIVEAWLNSRDSESPDAPLFSLQTESGALRDTAKMMRVDLDAARESWIDEVESEDERRRRRQSEFLKYDSGRGVADFHANRHTFISNLSRAGLSTKMAQSLARHSDVNLTLSVTRTSKPPSRPQPSPSSLPHRWLR